MKLKNVDKDILAVLANNNGILFNYLDFIIVVDNYIIDPCKLVVYHTYITDKTQEKAINVYNVLDMLKSHSIDEFLHLYGDDEIRLETINDLAYSQSLYMPVCELSLKRLNGLGSQFYTEV